MNNRIKAIIYPSIGYTAIDIDKGEVIGTLIPHIEYTEHPVYDRVIDITESFKDMIESAHDDGVCVDHIECKSNGQILDGVFGVITASVHITRDGNIKEELLVEISPVSLYPIK